MRSKYLLLGTLVGVLLFSGCETGGAKVASVSGKGSKPSSGGSINQESAKLKGNALVDYIYENKNAVLNASDCPKFSYRDWDNLYGDLIYKFAPAEPVVRSVDACRGVMNILEHTNYPLDRAARSSIEAGWLNGVVEDFDFSVENPPKREHLTFEKCQDMYSGYTQAQWAQEITKGDNIPMATACYHALLEPSNSQSYITNYNNGIYDGLQGIENFNEPQSDNGYHPNGSNIYVTEDERKQQDLQIVESFTKEECQEIFEGYSDYELQMYEIDYFSLAYDMSLSEDERWEYELLLAAISHCRKIMD